MIPLVFPRLVSLNSTIAYSAPTNAAITQNSYGDIRFSWANSAKPAPQTIINIINPSTGSTIRSATVPSSQTYYDYTVDMSGADFGFVPGSPSFKVAGSNNGVAVTSYAAKSGSPTLDNSHVAKLVVFAGDSQAAAHFENLSGATPDKWSATTFRDQYATLFGLNPAQVMPYSVGVGSACVEKEAAIDLQTPNEYFWDLSNGVPGPLATQAVSSIQALGVSPSQMVWMCDSDVGTVDDTSVTPTLTAVRFYQAMEALFTWFRSQFSNTSLPVFISPTMGAYTGTPEAALTPWAFEQLRGAQALTAYQQNGNTFLAAVPPVTGIGSYIAEASPNQTDYIHYQASIYQSVANAMAQAIYSNTNLAAAGGSYDGSVYPVCPENLACFQDGNGDNHLTWTDGLGRSSIAGATWTVNINDSSSGAVLRTLTSSTMGVTYTAAMANTDQGQSVLGYIDYTVTLTTSLGTSQANEFSNSPTTLAAPTGVAVIQDSSTDLVLSWTPLAGVSYSVTCYNVSTNAAMHTVTVGAGVGSWTYTAAQQTTDYGFTTRNYYFGVSQIQSGTGYVGSQAQKSGTAALWYVKPTTPKAVYQTNGDVIFSWTTTKSVPWQLKNYNVSTSSVASTVNLPAGTNTWTFTAAAQTALYGYTTHSIKYTVGQYDSTTGNVGSFATFNGTATSS